MRSRSTVTAALALAAVTILAIAACGTSVSGSAEVNTVAAETVATGTSSTATTTSTDSTETSEPSASTVPTALPTDLSELTALLSGLPSIPTDLSIPSDLGNLDIPGYSPECLTVSLAYASIFLATYPALLGGSDAFDASELQKAIDDLSGQVPPEIAGDIQALSEVAAEANGKTLTEVGELFDGDKFKTATANIEAWTNANCGG
jgi:hypothetical protein